MVIQHLKVNNEVNQQLCIFFWKNINAVSNYSILYTTMFFNLLTLTKKAAKKDGN